MSRQSILVLAVAGLAAGVWPASEEAATVRDHYQKAVAAYQAKDYPAFLSHASKAAELAPAHPHLQYRLACAYALNGQPSAAIRTLGLLAELGVHRDVVNDPDLAALVGDPGLPSLLKKLERLTRSVGDSRAAFEIPEPDLIPEGVAHHAPSGAFYVSSVHKRKIVRVGPDGSVADFTGDDACLWATLGIAVDEPRGALWAATDALPQMRGFATEDDGRTALVRFDLETGQPVARYGPPAGQDPHSFNDLAIDSQGEVLVSDPRAQIIYALAPEAEGLKALVEPGALLSPQGLALSADEKTLYVSDYARSSGIVAIDRETGAVSNLSVPETPTLYGIDGLMRHGGDLIAIQNGIRPHRVLRLSLDSEAKTISAVTVLEMNNPRFDEPTLGVVVGDALFYVANSQWGCFDDEGRIWPLDKLANPVVLKLPLAKQ